MRRFILNGGVTRVTQDKWTVWCNFSELPSEQEALLISEWLHDTVHGAITGLEMADDVSDGLRDHAADVHARDCPAREPACTCTCGHSLRSAELLREAAARIEVAVEMLQPYTKIEEDIELLRAARAAYYALTAERRG
jgi:hypothetical protein